MLRRTVGERWWPFAGEFTSVNVSPPHITGRERGSETSLRRADTAEQAVIFVVWAGCEIQLVGISAEAAVSER